ncbi:MAG TPA: hypothetical protein VN224_04765 [Xanthomonadales bacterium]|nr:hypothetical protein [Xanthomonadales bacterium]
MKRAIGLLALFYAALLFVSLHGETLHIAGPAAFRAARDLPPNHRIIDGDVQSVPLMSSSRTLQLDLSRPFVTSHDFVGRYAIYGAAKPHAIRFEDTEPKPRFWAHDTRLIAWIPLNDIAPGFAAALDAGDGVDACGAHADTCLINLVISAIWCGSDEKTACAAGIRVERKDGSRALAILKSRPLRLLLRKKAH